MRLQLSQLTENDSDAISTVFDRFQVVMLFLQPVRHPRDDDYCMLDIFS